MRNAKPFVKWAGGKGQLLSEIRKKYPAKITKYCEPFLGGGAVLFDILSSFQPERILINDINAELVNAYKIVKTNPDDLIFLLFELQEKYRNSNSEEQKNLFYEKRMRFNELKFIKNDSENLEKAALFIFLNKTCFNGLYRENANGFFNVPFNRAKNPAICDAENLKECSKVLQNVQMISADYSLTEDFIDKNTFVYIDPPYRPINKTSSFISYSKNGFFDKEQRELQIFIEKIAEKGAKIVASNSDPKNADKNDNFFDDLYANFKIERVFANRMINSNAKKRGSISELLISSANL